MPKKDGGKTMRKRENAKEGKKNGSKPAEKKSKSKKFNPTTHNEDWMAKREVRKKGVTLLLPVSSPLHMLLLSLIVSFPPCLPPSPGRA
jgi:hypothetical protein